MRPPSARSDCRPVRTGRASLLLTNGDQKIGILAGDSDGQLWSYPRPGGPRRPGPKDPDRADRNAFTII